MEKGGGEDPSCESEEETEMQNETVFHVWKWRTLIKYLSDRTRKMTVNSGMSQPLWDLLSSTI